MRPQCYGCGERATCTPLRLYITNGKGGVGGHERLIVFCASCTERLDRALDASTSTLGIRSREQARELQLDEATS